MSYKLNIFGATDGSIEVTNEYIKIGNKHEIETNILHRSNDEYQHVLKNIPMPILGSSKIYLHKSDEKKIVRRLRMMKIKNILRKVFL